MLRCAISKNQAAVLQRQIEKTPSLAYLASQKLQKLAHRGTRPKMRALLQTSNIDPILQFLHPERQADIFCDQG